MDIQNGYEVEKPRKSCAQESLNVNIWLPAVPMDKMKTGRGLGGAC